MRALVGFGSNLGDRRGHFERALIELARRGVRVLRASPIFVTAPRGAADAGFYWNLVAEVRADPDPWRLLRILGEIEASCGRVRGRTRWAARSLDLDIVAIAGVRIVSADLTVPHPRWRGRGFVEAPLALLGAFDDPSWGLGPPGVVGALARQSRACKSSAASPS